MHKRAIPSLEQPHRITVLVPAYNEAASLADTIKSLKAQTHPPTEIIVIDDCSTDSTGVIAEAAGATVVRPPTPTGSKAGAQNFALPLVRTEFVMALDADTVLAPDALEQLLPSFQLPQVAAACGFVLPRHVRTVWERGRYIEYLFAFTFYKQVQDFCHPMIASGCFSVYRTAVLRQHAGWPTATVAEDMDLTWRLYQSGFAVRFVPTAVSYPTESETFDLMRRQIRRSAHGFVQNLRVHWRGIMNLSSLRPAVTVATWEALVGSMLFLVLLPVLAVLLRKQWLLLGYVIGVAALLGPIVVGAVRRGELRRALASLPAFFVRRTVRAVYFLRAAWVEWVAKRPLLVCEKGH
jgi:cellulose synthase/poly-beta-1,6-N-acetylglucosamine synthase-like glycosyltransferase